MGGRERQPLTTVEIKEVAIVLDFDVGHLVAAAHGEREGARIRGGEAGEEGAVESLLLQQFLSFDARYRWVEPSAEWTEYGLCQSLDHCRCSPSWLPGGQTYGCCQLPLAIVRMSFAVSLRCLLPCIPSGHQWQVQWRTVEHSGEQWGTVGCVHRFRSIVTGYRTASAVGNRLRLRMKQCRGNGSAASTLAPPPRPTLWCTFYLSSFVFCFCFFFALPCFCIYLYICK